MKLTNSRLATGMPKELREVFNRWLEVAGWAGWGMLGGLDANGNIVYKRYERGCTRLVFLNAMLLAV